MNPIALCLTRSGALTARMGRFWLLAGAALLLSACASVQGPRAASGLNDRPDQTPTVVISPAEPMHTSEANAEETDLSADAIPIQTDAAPASKAKVDAGDKPLPEGQKAVELTAGRLYQFLLGEIALQRKQAPVALAAYSALAQDTQDGRLARRATEIAIFTQNLDVALHNAKIWSEAEPSAVQAQLTLASLFSAAGLEEPTRQTLVRLLAEKTRQERVAIFLQLPSVFAKERNVQRVWADMDTVTSPYRDDPQARFVRALAAWRAGEKVIATDEIAQALAMKTDWEQAALLQAQIAEGGVQALENLGRFCKDNPKALVARKLYARLLAGANRFDEARREFDTILALDPEDLDILHTSALLAWATGERDRAQAQFEKLAANPNPVAQQNGAYYLGEIALAKQQLDVALRWFSQVRGGRNALAARLRSAAILSTTGKLDDALQLLEQTRGNNDQDRLQIIQSRVQLLRQAGRHQEVYDRLKAGLVQMPGQPDLLYEALIAADKMGVLDESERYFRALIQIKPDFAHAYNAFGYALADRNLRLDEAGQWIDKAVALAPGDPFILDSKGWLLYRQGKMDEAAQMLKKALSARADPEIAAHYGEVLWQAGQKEEARKIWAGAHQAHPDNDALKATMRRFILDTPESRVTP
jgi:tetratricopeptide (TPR) repeat protein